MSLRFHLSRRTGEVTKVIERGTKSIDVMLYFMLFNIAPTVIELTAVAVIFWFHFGWGLVAATALGLAIADRRLVAAGLVAMTLQKPEGIVYGTAGMLDGIIDRIRETIPGETPTIVATGSNAPVIVRYCRNKVLYDKYLLMEGLWAIYHKNRP